MIYYDAITPHLCETHGEADDRAMRYAEATGWTANQGSDASPVHGNTIHIQYAEDPDSYLVGMVLHTRPLSEGERVTYAYAMGLIH